MGTKQRRRTEEGERSLKTARIAQTQISINHKKGGGGPCPTPNLRIWHISSYKDCFSSQNRKKRKKINTFFQRPFLLYGKNTSLLEVGTGTFWVPRPQRYILPTLLHSHLPQRWPKPLSRIQVHSAWPQLGLAAEKGVWWGARSQWGCDAMRLPQEAPQLRRKRKWPGGALGRSCWVWKCYSEDVHLMKINWGVHWWFIPFSACVLQLNKKFTLKKNQETEQQK